MDLERAKLRDREKLLELGLAWRRGEYADDAFQHEVWDYLNQQHTSVLHHEIHHLHQAIAYPGLFLRATRESQIVSEAIRWFREQEQDIPLIRGPDGIPEIDVIGPVGSSPHADGLRHTYYDPVKWYGLRLERERIVPFDVDIGNPNAVRITESDLLEDEAAVFEFLSNESNVSGSSFEDWVASRPAPCVTFELLVSLGFSADAALWTIPPLVYFAYQTTIPMGAFASLAQQLRDRNLHRASAPDDGYLAAVTLVCSQTLDSMFPAAGSDFPVLGLSQNDPAVVLTSKRARLAEESDNPLATDVARAAAGDWPSPIDFCWPSPELSERLRASFFPPYAFVRLLHPQFGAGSIGFSIRLASEPGDIRERVRNLDAAKPIFDLLFFGSINGRPSHNCLHSECRNRTRLCWNYSFFPWRWEDCTFPHLFSDQAWHEIDVPGSRLAAATQLGGSRG